MGGGGLRILPHKTWHVWRRDNIERVLKDEREYEEKRFDMDAKERSREQERRVQQLKAKGPETTQTQVKHVNLFELEEVQARSRDGVEDRKKKGKGKEETLQRYGQLPWYAQPEKAQKALSSRQERQKKRYLELSDPLREMRPKEERGQCLVVSSARLEEKEGSCKIVRARTGGSDTRKYSGNYRNCLSTSRDSKERNRLCRDEVEEERTAGKVLNKHSKYRAKKRKHELCRKETMLEELRRERDDREASERRRAEKLLYG